MIEILDFIFTNFWIWLGSMILFYILTRFIVGLINTFMYHRTIRKIGYPPAHCAKEELFNAIKEEKEQTD